MSRTIAFIHQNGPGQFVHLMKAVAAQGDRVVCFTKAERDIPGAVVVRYTPSGLDDVTATEAGDLEKCCIHARAVAKGLGQIVAQGITPDLVIGHTGWGELLYVRDILPRTPVIGYFEYFYNHLGQDVGFDPEFAVGDRAPRLLRLRNANPLLSDQVVDVRVTPTEWQRSVFPADLRNRMTVLHEGVDTHLNRPRSRASLRLSPTVEVTRDSPVVTYVARNLEPYRGFHVFMRAAKIILERHPTVRILVVGGDKVSYGSEHPSGRPYREVMLEEIGGEHERLHFLGRVSYDVFRTLLSVSSAHIYLTYPFVLSWSMLEAMATGCLVIGSATPPVTEVIVDGRNGRLVDFFDAQGIAEAALEAVNFGMRFMPMRQNARRTVLERFDMHGICLPRWRSLIDETLS